jgi:prepilin-type N-terminal cleavage/methylation domain-containing protein
MSAFPSEGRSFHGSAAPNLEGSYPEPRVRLGLSAFTLLELMVVVAIIAILASLLLPALRLAKIKAQGTYCMNNGHQIVVAAWLYSDENSDWLPPNPQEGSIGWVTGDITRYPDATNIWYLTDPRYAKLGPYTRSAKVWKCPSDHGTTRAGSERVRSLAINEAVGTKPEIIAPVDGEWLDGSGFHHADHPWRTYGRISQMASLHRPPYLS